MEYILTSLDMIAGITDNLINYAFNVSLFSSCSRLVWSQRLELTHSCSLRWRPMI